MPRQPLHYALVVTEEQLALIFRALQTCPISVQGVFEELTPTEQNHLGHLQCRSAPENNRAFPYVNEWKE